MKNIKHRKYLIALCILLVFGCKDSSRRQDSSDIVDTGKTGDKDNIVRIVTNDEEIAKIKSDNKAGGFTSSSLVTSGVSTTKTVIAESLNVLDRTIKNGGLQEERSLVTNTGEVIRSPSGSAESSMIDGIKVHSSDGETVSGRDNVLIHSHLTAFIELPNGRTEASSALQPGFDDPASFKNRDLNIVVGNLGMPTKTEKTLTTPSRTYYPRKGAVFYDTNGVVKLQLTYSALSKIK